MKRTLSVFVLAFAMVALVGCKKKAAPAAGGVSVPKIEQSDVDAAKTTADNAAAKAKETAADASKSLPTK